MSRALRVFGLLAWAPNGWDIVPSPNGSRQRMALVAAPTQAAALRAFGNAGVGVSAYYFREYGYPDVAGDGADLALSEPGRVFYRPGDMRGDFVPAP